MNQCVILAGGLGTRMWPEAKTVPKTLLPVGGRPFAAFQLDWLAAAGVDSVVYCIGHLGRMVRDYVGDGRGWGLAVSYVEEHDKLRGTAGALRLAADEGVLDDDFLVLYGDSWLQVDPMATLSDARCRPEPAFMTVFANDGAYDTSNVVFDGGRVIRYEKNLDPRPPEMRWIDYGLLSFHRDVIVERISAGRWADLAPLCTALAAEGLLAGAEVTDRFYEIGSPAGRDELALLLTSG